MLLAVPVVLLADGSKTSSDLQTGVQQVIIQYTAHGHEACKQFLGVVDCLVNDIQQLGGQVIKRLPEVHALVALLDSNGITILSKNPDVIYISKDRKVTALADDATAAVNAPVAWQSGYTGAGVGVALIDSGINEHPDFDDQQHGHSRVVFHQSFIHKKEKLTQDEYGHGTHIAGLIAGDGLSSTGPDYSQTFTGIAPGAHIVNLRVLNVDGSATDSEVIAAIEHAISLRHKENIRVINLSLGRGVFESYKKDPLCKAVEKAWKAGIVVVVAAGNNGRYQPTDGYGTITSPGNDPYVITVGAMKTMGTPERNDDLIASYSSKGPTLIDHIVKPDIVAPGNLLISTETPDTLLYSTETHNQVPYSSYVYGGLSTPSTKYFTLSGTSMATGVVSGVVADLLEANPRLTPDQVKARLMKTASKTFPTISSVYDPVTAMTYTDQYDIFTVGAGYVDLAAALADVELPKGTAMSPTAVYDAQTGNVRLTSDKSSLWGTSYAWSGPSVWGQRQFVGGSTVMWGATNPGGSTVMWGATGLWGSTVMWGAGTSSGFAAIWSDTVMWGANDDGRSTVMWGATMDNGEPDEP